MADGIWNKETFIDCPDKRTQDAMTHDMLSSLNTNILEIREMPAKCELTMDTKIKASNKRSGKFNIGLGGGSGIGAVGLWELFKSFFSNP